MSWMIPEDKLDEAQRKSLEKFDFNQENIWIRGFPGSGKSVLLAYTMKRIKKKHPNAEVIVVVFTHSLIRMYQAAFVEMGIAVNIVTYYAFMDNNKHYDYILCDEIQDMTAQVLQAMNSRADHMVVAGDENQSIYGRDPKYKEETVTTTQIRNLLNASDYELRIIHRLSSSIINAVQRFHPDMNVLSAKRDMTKESTEIRLCVADSVAEEAEYIFREAKKSVNIGRTAAILIPTHTCAVGIIQNILKSEEKKEWSVSVNKYGKIDYSAMNEYLSRNGIPIQYVGNGYGLFSEDSRTITLMTYHSSKGLDFDNVFLPCLDSIFLIPDEKLRRTLFMVGMTRSRNNLYLTYSRNYQNPYVKSFANDCTKINIHDYLSGQNVLGGNVFGF